MAYAIDDRCAACALCVPACPNGAISEGDMIMIIDPDKCTECVGWNRSPQCVEACPNDAVVLDPAHQESKDQLQAKWLSLHQHESQGASG
jgi:Fe-S-cluster-containing hydrogenase component 2